MVEFIIWGKPPHADHEALLVSEAAGIKSREHAERVVQELQSKHNCSEVRIQEFKMGDGLELAEMFRAVA